MDNDENKEILDKQEETLVLVQKLWKAEKWHRFWTVFRYVIYVGVLFGAFYFATPYIEKFINLTQQFKDVKSVEDLQGLLQRAGQ